MSGSVAQRLARATIAIVAVSTAAAALVFVGLENRALEEVIVERQGLSARRGAAALAHELRLATEELEHVARRIGRGELEDPQQILDAERELTVFFTGRVLLVDEQGRCRGIAPIEEPCADLDDSQRSWLETAREEPRSVVVFAQTDARERHIDLLVPIRDRDGFFGLLRGEILLTRDDLMLDESVAGPAGLPHALALLDHSDSVLFRDGDPGLSTDAWVATPPGARLVDGPDGSLVVAKAGLTNMRASMLYVWRLADLDTGAAKRRMLAAIAFLVLVFVGGMVGWLAARSVVRPVTALSEDVQRFKTSGVPLPVAKGADEIDELRTSFRALIDELATKTKRAESTRDELVDLTATLESRVDERTRSLEQTRDALVEAERLATLGRAGAALSHELRNALNSLSVGFDAIGSGLAGEAAVEVKREVRHEIARLRSLADTLLDFAANRRAKRRVVDLAQLYERCLSLVKDEGGSTSEHVWICEAPAKAWIDGDIIQSALANLMLNAQLAGANRVEVRVDEQDGALRFRVDDDGPGVDATLKDSLFDPFVSGRVGGVGLGLAISRRFAEMHGGTLTVVHGSLGGACFELILPDAFNAAALSPDHE